MERKTSQSKVLCASCMFSIYALPLGDSTRLLMNLQNFESFLQMLNTEMRCEHDS